MGPRALSSPAASARSSSSSLPSGPLLTDTSKGLFRAQTHSQRLLLPHPLQQPGVDGVSSSTHCEQDARGCQHREVQPSLVRHVPDSGVDQYGYLGGGDRRQHVDDQWHSGEPGEENPSGRNTKPTTPLTRSSGARPGSGVFRILPNESFMVLSRGNFRKIKVLFLLVHRNSPFGLGSGELEEAEEVGVSIACYLRLRRRAVSGRAITATSTSD